jgi:uncharacterized membrane protein (Fun14 family)
MQETTQSFGPILLSLLVSFVGGWVIGRTARRALATTMLVTGVILALLAVLGRLGVDGSIADQWVRSGSGWLGANIEGAGRYLATLLPAATAATAGGLLGFRKKK